MNLNLHVNKTNGFVLRLALKQRRNATRKSPIVLVIYQISEQPAIKNECYLVKTRLER